jgi:hypothetical protein
MHTQETREVLTAVLLKIHISCNAVPHQLVATDISKDLQGQAVLEVKDSSLLGCDTMSLSGYILKF